MGNNLFILGATDSIANEYLFAMRDAVQQKDRFRFRKNLERLGEILAYELSKRLSFVGRTVTTPLGKVSMNVLETDPVLITILRAGVPFQQGFLNFFDKSDCGFIGAYRQEGQEQVRVSVDYVSIPPVNGKPVVLIDPMLATGRSVLQAEKVLLSKGTPAHVYIVSVVAAPEGIQLLRQHLTLPHSLWTCAVDEKLDENAYIVPGLGDAGDLSYGVRG